MPVILDTPEQLGLPIIIKEVVGFTVDLTNGVLSLYIDGVDGSGKVIPDELKKSRLFRANGTPRFTTEEYETIKAVVYRLAIEDGHLPAGTIV